jgi:hypothetical protein
MDASHITGRFAVSVAVCVACACSKGATAASTPDTPTEAIVASVNGEPILVAELQVAAGHVRARVAADFTARYGVAANGAFWTTPLGTERPVDVLKQQALAVAVERKVEQLLMRDQGILPDVSHREYLAALDRENARRREALERGEPIYGPQQYGEQEYLEYLISNGIVALKQRLFGLAASDAELRRDYDAVKVSTFSRGRRVRVEVVQQDYSRDARQDGRARQAAAAAMSRIQTQVRDGVTLTATAARNPGVALSELVVEDGPRTVNRFGARDLVQEAALKLDLHGYSHILDTGHSLAIVHCVAIEPLGYRSFEEVRAQLQYQHIDRALHARVQQLVDRADVRIDRSVYDGVVVQ